MHLRRLKSMESKITITIKNICIIILIFLPLSLYSQNSRINIYSAGTYEIPYGDFRSPDIYPGKGNANDGASFNLGSQIKLYKNLFIGIECAYTKFGPRKKVANYDIYVSLYSFVMNTTYYFQQNDFRPYITIGGGLSPTSLNVQTDFFEESSTETVTSINITIGCDMLITEHTALFGFTRWNDNFIRGKDFEFEHFQTLEPQFNENFIGFGAGIKYWF